MDALLHPMFDADALKKAKEVATGLAASPGAACGQIALTPEKAKEMHEEGKKLFWLEAKPAQKILKVWLLR